MASSDAATPEEYIEELEGERREDVVALDGLIREHAPKLERHMQSGMLGYGRYRYRYASGKEGEWFVIGLASQKRYISLYVCAADDQGYLAERYADRLPKADIGKSCVRFKRLEDVDADVVADMVDEAAKLGGMSAV
jgi:Domain of unknown function (DU1801)